jgi:hypothetical protein
VSLPFFQAKNKDFTVVTNGSKSRRRITYSSKSQRRVAIKNRGRAFTTTLEGAGGRGEANNKKHNRMAAIKVP